MGHSFWLLLAQLALLVLVLVGPVGLGFEVAFVDPHLVYSSGCKFGEGHEIPAFPVRWPIFILWSVQFVQPFFLDVFPHGLLSLEMPLGILWCYPYQSCGSHWYRACWDDLCSPWCYFVYRQSDLSCCVAFGAGWSTRPLRILYRGNSNNFTRARSILRNSSPSRKEERNKTY